MTKPTVSKKKVNSVFQHSDHLYKNIDVAFFEAIICGPLRPFLPLYDSPEELQKLTTITVEGKFEIGELMKWHQNGSIPKDVLEKFNVIEGDNISFRISDHNALYITFSKPEDLLDPVFDINLPDPPDEKAKAFLHHIKIEFDLMKQKAQKVLKIADSFNVLTLYANKNIQSLKDIATRAGALYKKINPDNINFQDDPNVYIIFIVKEFLIHAIMFYQQLFRPFLSYECEDYHYLKNNLYINKINPIVLVPGKQAKDEINHFYKRADDSQVSLVKFTPIDDNKERSECPNSFTLIGYNSKLSLLTLVMESLKANGFICGYTNIKDFRKIFNNETPQSNIKWLTHISDLAHFVRLLHDIYKVIENIDKAKWKVTDKIFVDVSGLSFGWENFSGKKVPARSRLIENAVEFLK